MHCAYAAQAPLTAQLHHTQCTVRGGSGLNEVRMQLQLMNLARCVACPFFCVLCVRWGTARLGLTSCVLNLQGPLFAMHALLRYCKTVLIPGL